MKPRRRQLFIAVTIENKYLQAGIRNSYAAEKSGISLAELYGLQENQANKLNFRKTLLKFLNQATPGPDKK